MNNLKKSELWKIHLTIIINFISSKDDNDEEREMHSKSNNIEIMINDETEEVLEKLFKSPKKRIFPSEEDDWKKIEKNNQTITLNVLYAKKNMFQIMLPIFQNITQIVKIKLFF